MRVLVTGASGFSGANIARDFAARGFDVVATYRRDAGLAESLTGNKRVALVRADLRAPLASIAGPFDAIVHAAATSIWTDITVDQMVGDNVEATRALLAAARGWACGKFIYFSSLSVHGEFDRAVVDESTPLRDPDAYGMTKRLGELMLAERAPGLSGLAMRLPGVVGPGAQRNWLAVAAGKIKRGEKLRAFNLDAPYNNAVHIADIGAFAAKMISGGWEGYDAVLLSARGETTIRAALDRLARAMGKTVDIESAPSPKAPYTLSCAHAMARWGFAPMTIEALLDRYAQEV